MAWNMHNPNKEGCLQEVVLGWGDPHSSDATTAGHQVGPLFGTFGVQGLIHKVCKLVFVKHVQLAKHCGWPNQGKTANLQDTCMRRSD